MKTNSTITEPLVARLSAVGFGNWSPFAFHASRQTLVKSIFNKKSSTRFYSKGTPGVLGSTWSSRTPNFLKNPCYNHPMQKEASALYKSTPPSGRVESHDPASLPSLDGAQVIGNPPRRGK